MMSDVSDQNTGQSTSTNGQSTNMQGQNQNSGGFLRGLFKVFGLGRSEGSLKESLEEVIEEHDDGSVDENAMGHDERSMLMNVLKYDDQRVDEIMVPRADIIAISDKATMRDLIDLIADASHSRIPVYGNTMDDIIGMIHVKDVVKCVASDIAMDKLMPLDKLMRPVLFVAPSMKLPDLLKRMKQSRTHLGVIVDEYGGTDGLVSIEDLIEQIVGNIEDEHDDDDIPAMNEVSTNEWHVDARLDFEEFESVFDTDLLPDDRDDDIETVGGLVVSLAGRVPKIGETVSHSAGFEFTVIDADMRRLTKISVKRVDSEDDETS